MFGPKPKLFKRHKYANLTKQMVRNSEKFRAPKIILDSARPAHINIQVNVARAGVYKNCPTYKEKDMHGLPIPTEIDFDREFAREEKRNLEIVNLVTRKLRSGRHKGAEVDIEVVNNEPGLRYHRNAWK
jgi:hypothetical protein